MAVLFEIAAVKIVVIFWVLMYSDSSVGYKKRYVLEIWICCLSGEDFGRVSSKIQ